MNQCNPDKAEKMTTKKAIVVFIGGFPIGSKISDIRNFMQGLVERSKFTVMTDSKNCFKGFVFVNFDLLEEATAFADKEFTYQDKSLDLKVMNEQGDFLNESIQNLKEPRKVYVSKLPKHLTKTCLSSLFKSFGPIKDVLIIDRKDRNNNFAYVQFKDTISAKNCVAKKGITTEEGQKYPAYYANPIFSNNMLEMVHLDLKGYISDIQKQIKVYSPKGFGIIQAKILKKGESLVKIDATSKKSKGNQNKAKKNEQGFYVKKDKSQMKIVQEEISGNNSNKDCSSNIQNKCIINNDQNYEKDNGSCNKTHSLSEATYSLDKSIKENHRKQSSEFQTKKKSTFQNDQIKSLEEIASYPNNLITNILNKNPDLSGDQLSKNSFSSNKNYNHQDYKQNYINYNQQEYHQSSINQNQPDYSQNPINYNQNSNYYDYYSNVNNNGHYSNEYSNEHYSNEYNTGKNEVQGCYNTEYQNYPIYDNTNNPQYYTNIEAVPQNSYQNSISQAYNDTETFSYNQYTPNNKTYETNKDENTSYTTQNISNQYNGSLKYYCQDPSSNQLCNHTNFINNKYQQENDCMMNVPSYYNSQSNVYQDNNEYGFRTEKDQKNQIN